MFFNQPTRRELLKSAAATLTAWLLPHRLFARTPHRFFFLHTDTLDSWPVADPVTWAFKNQGEPILERATDGLLKLTPSDGDRIVRLVVRRCGLNLIELQPKHVAVQHWGTQGLADLRPWFKVHGLARREVEVVVRDRKKEVAVVQHGDDFLFGDRIALDFPLDLFQNKWARRFERDADDWQAVPGTSSGFAWDGLEDSRIPWAALKSAWRRLAPGTCLNCDGQTMLVNFGLRPVGVFNRSPHFVRVCGACRRSFKDESVKDVAGWMAANLDTEVRPDFEMVWGKRVNRMAT